MRIASLLLGLFFYFGVILDAFQTIILPRRPRGRFRITRLFYIATWRPWIAGASFTKSRKVREQIYSIYGPMSLLVLLGLWAVLLVSGFALIYFSLGTPFADALNGRRLLFDDLSTNLYVSGTTLFTLGLGDVTPKSLLVRALVVIEAGTGLGFVALVIGYVPVLYQAFSHREVSVAMLDGRAGSPPTATELLRRHAYQGGEAELIALLAEWERWSAEILESHISYPILSYYRSQHDNQSWLSALVSVLDACALLITTVEGAAARQAQLTFTMARHALVDIGHVLHAERSAKEKEIKGLDRLSSDTLRAMCESLGDLHMRLCGDPESMRRLSAIRMLYEPHAHALSNLLKMDLPQWIPAPKKADTWKTIADLRAGGPEALGMAEFVSDRSTASHLHDELQGF